jgi:hypothetical protein
MTVCGLSLLIWTQSASGISSYQNRVPNGPAFSCDTCHDLISGAPDRNPFGTAFANNGHVWNAALAALDSDGDGFKNGQELGDAAGTWTPGSPAPGGTITNPGDPSSKPAVAAPTITTQPASQTVTAGANVTFSVVASGTAPLSYQWAKNGANVAGATSATLTLNNVATSAAGSYTVVVSNSGGSITSSAATLTVNPAIVAPSITTQPASQTVTAGANVTFSVVASGTAPLSYQWAKNGANIAGATSASLTLNAVATSAAGSYTVVVSNSGGSVTSSAATLTVNPAIVAPSITTQPASQTVTAGANVTFSVVASGTAPLSYQWAKNGANISGATSATLTLNNVATSAAGSYTVVVSNSGGSVTSSAATLTVNPAIVAPSITTQPASQTVTAGANVTFSVVASGTAPLSYQWRKDGANIAGATSASLTLNAVPTSAAGSYTVVVSNSGGSVTSATATLTVNPAVVAPSITTQPVSQTVTAGANVTFMVVASGTTPMSYQWQKNGANIAGATGASLVLTAVTSANAGSYTVIVSNSAGSATSSAATLTVNPAPIVLTVTLTGPTNGEVFATAPADVTLEAAVTSGNTVLSVEFFDGATSVGIVTTAPYSLVSSNLAAGEHVLTAKVTDSQGTAVSDPVTITVGTPQTPTNLAPVVSIISPANGARVSTYSRVYLAAQASDPDGTVTNVTFYAGSTPLGTAVAVQHEVDDDHESEGSNEHGGTLYLLVLNRPAAGQYVITAKATDNLGTTTTSAPVTMTVRRLSWSTDSFRRDD